MKNEELDQMIEKSFRTEPGFQLPANFAQKVAFAVVLGFYYFVDKAFVLQSIAFLSNNMIPVILVVFLLNFIWFADRVLLGLLFSRWSKT